jgi:mannitol-specific phosphotransferase system IIBC component
LYYEEKAVDDGIFSPLGAGRRRIQGASITFTMMMILSGSPGRFPGRKGDL